MDGPRQDNLLWNPYHPSLMPLSFYTKPRPLRCLGRTMGIVQFSEYAISEVDSLGEVMTAFARAGVSWLGQLHSSLSRAEESGLVLIIVEHPKLYPIPPGEEYPTYRLHWNHHANSPLTLCGATLLEGPQPFWIAQRPADEFISL